MNEKEYGKIIAQNLRRIAYESEKTQADMSRDLNTSKATISSWMNGTRIPRMENIDLLCHYFNCKRSDIMEKHEEAKRPNLRLSKEELSLLSIYRSLNSVGKEKLLDYLSDLSENPKYTKDTELENEKEA